MRKRISFIAKIQEFLEADLILPKIKFVFFSDLKKLTNFLIIEKF